MLAPRLFPEFGVRQGRPVHCRCVGCYHPAQSLQGEQGEQGEVQDVVHGEVHGGSTERIAAPVVRCRACNASVLVHSIQGMWGSAISAEYNRMHARTLRNLRAVGTPCEVSK